MSLANYIIFENGVQKWLFIGNPHKLDKVLVDPRTKQKKTVQVRRWSVTRENKSMVHKHLDVTSSKFDADLMALFELDVLSYKEVGITRYGEGWDTTYTIETRPLQG